jgi:WD40 repeat protein
VGPRRHTDRHASRSHQLGIAPDGDLILTASGDNTARLWNEDGAPIAILRGHTGLVIQATFARDGGILSASYDGTARLWEAFPQFDGLVHRVKAEVPRCLTLQQRQLLFLAPQCTSGLTAARHPLIR